MTDKVEDEEGARSFSHLLATVADGALLAEASDENHDLVSFLQDETLAREVKLKGSISITLKYEAKPNGSVDVTYDVKVKKPSRGRRVGTMFFTKGGNLSTEHQTQTKFSFPREVRIERGEAREVVPQKNEG